MFPGEVTGLLGPVKFLAYSSHRVSKTGSRRACTSNPACYTLVEAHQVLALANLHSCTAGLGLCTCWLSIRASSLPNQQRVARRAAPSQVRAADCKAHLAGVAPARKSGLSFQLSTSRTHLWGGTHEHLPIRKILDFWDLPTQSCTWDSCGWGCPVMASAVCCIPEG